MISIERVIRGKLNETIFRIGNVIFHKVPTVGEICNSSILTEAATLQCTIAALWKVRDVLTQQKRTISVQCVRDGLMDFIVLDIRIGISSTCSFSVSSIIH